MEETWVSGQVLKLYNTIGQKELHLATFLKLTPPSESSLGFDTTGMSWSQYITVLQAEELIAQAGGHVVGEAVAKAGALITRRLGAKIAKAFSANVKAANRTPDGPNPGTRPGATDAEAGIGTSTVKFDGSPTAHEARLGQELAEQGLDVRIRGENVPGPDAQINGLWYDIKELSGTGRRSLQSSINSAKNNFSNNGAAGLGLGRSDTRALIDARGNGTWDNAASIRTELDRLSRNGDLSNVAEVRVITSNGPIVWKPQ